ncbi:hypothetical protein BD779DRAFT_1445762, partial [Infundibulicybe gibba]
YTETSVVPLRFRRLNLALRYLQYLIPLPNECYAGAALNDSVQLAAEGNSHALITPRNFISYRENWSSRKTAGRDIGPCASGIT